MFVLESAASYSTHFQIYGILTFHAGVMNSTTTVVITSTFTVVQSSSTQTLATIITPITTMTSSYTGLQTTLACSTGSHACPVNLGGGCCGSGYACASSSSCLLLSSQSTTPTSSLVVTSSTATGVVAVRPTGETTTTTTTATDTTCPTGFYACEAYYAGGCCRTGRNCDTTSCPAISSTTIISSGVTVVVPVGSAAMVTSPTGSCATGWFSCASSVGGSCCPSGYSCGLTSCLLVEATATVVTQKESPNQGPRSLYMSGSAVAFVGVLMVLLVLTQ